MKNLITSPEILKKLQGKHDVTLREVEQCFESVCGTYLTDTRENHRTDPPTLWFVAPTNTGRMLKVIFIYREGSIYLKSAYNATAEIQSMYARHAK